MRRMVNHERAQFGWFREKMKKRGSNPVVLPERSIKTLANSIYTTLREEGCEHKDIIGVSSKLIGQVRKRWRIRTRRTIKLVGGSPRKIEPTARLASGIGSIHEDPRNHSPKFRHNAPRIIFFDQILEFFAFRR